MRHDRPGRRADALATSAVPWLLLATKGTGADGSFSNVSSIQRVDYVATYRFFVAN